MRIQSIKRNQNRIININKFNRYYNLGCSGSKSCGRSHFLNAIKLSHSIGILDRNVSGRCGRSAIILLAAPFLVHEFLYLVLKILMLLPVQLTSRHPPKLPIRRRLLMATFYLDRLFLPIRHFLPVVRFDSTFTLINLPLRILIFNQSIF